MKHFYNDRNFGKIEIELPDDISELMPPDLAFMWWLKSKNNDAYDYVYQKSKTDGKTFDDLANHLNAYLKLVKDNDEQISELFKKDES